MAASIARTVTAILFALAMVGSVAVGPALADDDDVSVGDDGVSVGDDDGTTVGVGDDGSENGSTTVEAEADEDGVDAGVEAGGGDGDGNSGELDCDVSSDTQDPSDDCETSSGDSGGDDPALPSSGDAPEAPDGDAPAFPDGSLPEGDDSSGSSDPVDPIRTPGVPVDAPDLPVSYTGDGIEAQGETVVPFDALPNYCNPPYGVDDVRENNPVDPTDPVPDNVSGPLPGAVPTKPPQTPVGDPTSLIGAPISQCDVFNPYNPAVNPTSPPDDPSATVDPRAADVGQDGVYLFWVSDGTADEEDRSPGAETLNYVIASQERSRVLVMAYGTNGKTDTGGSAYVSSPNDPSRTDGTFAATAFDRSASLNLDCDGSNCKLSAGGVPSGDAVPAFPAGGGDGDEDPQPDPSADTGEPDLLLIGQDGAIIADDRRATLGDGLPGGDNEAIIITTEDHQEVQQDANGGQGDNQANVENEYQGGEHPGDDDAQTVAKVNGGGVVVGFNCNDYRCAPTEGTGVYAGPAGMIFEMLPSNPVQG